MQAIKFLSVYHLNSIKYNYGGILMRIGFIK